MKIIVAIDSLKGSLTSMEAGRAVREGILRALPQAEVVISPLADGGEGTVNTLVSDGNGSLETLPVTGPLGSPVQSQYGILSKGASKTAVIEMASAAGLPLVPPDKRDPLTTTTFGVGELIRDAILKGCRRFLIGIGGSATNDGGIGMLQALGYELLNKDGLPVSHGAKGLSELAFIKDSHVLPELSECSFRIACDVKNPLCGPQGCSAVFGPQKGASPESIAEMDQWLSRFACLTQKIRPGADPCHPGTGAAGGIGFAFLAYTNAVLEPGAEIVIEETGLKEQIQGADLVVTGEGRLDGQTAMGKCPIVAAKAAKEFQKPVIAFSGCVTKDAVVCNTEGIDAFFPILRTITSLEEALVPQNAYANLADTAEQVFRLIRTMQAD